jgi:hypothetical protein
LEVASPVYSEILLKLNDAMAAVAAVVPSVVLGEDDGSSDEE